MSVKNTFYLVILSNFILVNCFAQHSVDVRSEYESWNSGISNRSNALLYGLGVSYKINQKYSVGGGLVTGNYAISDKHADLSRTDMDIAIGYRRTRNVFVFAGYRLIKTNYQRDVHDTRAFEDITHGPGLGTSFYRPLKPNLLAYGRVMGSMMLSHMDLEDKPVDRGLGISMGLETGLAFQINSKISAGAALKYQRSFIDYKNGSGRWNHEYYRIGLSLSHSI